jgi:hypothetical protein
VDLWTFLWLMLFLKLPIAGLLGLVWWAIRQKPLDEVPVTGHDGGIKPRPRHPHRPGSRLPRHPRRGPHGGLAAAPPARVRTVTARVRRVQH